MQIQTAAYRDGQLMLATSDREALRFAYEFKAGDYEIKPRKQRRSLDANALAWVLIDKIAEAVRLDKSEVYRNAIREIGGVSETVCVLEIAADNLCSLWESRGIGWQTERMPSKIDGCVNVVLYYGSSAYDRKQMSVLIDHLVQDAQALGIETLPPDRLTAMVDEWGR